MEQPAPSRAGLIGSARGLAATALGLASNRLSLLGLEVAEEQSRFLSLLLYGLASVLLLGAGLVFLAAFITVALWDSNRLLALGMFAAAFTGAGAVCWLAARTFAARESTLFAASLAELRKDRIELGAGRRE